MKPLLASLALSLVVACASSNEDVANHIRKKYDVPGQVECVRNADYARVCRHIPSGRLFQCSFTSGCSPAVTGCVEITGRSSPEAQ